jgi:Rho-type GTPase-activating protein 1/2
MLCSVMEHSEKNLMTARNLGVVFGREYRHFVNAFATVAHDRDPATLMRSRDPGAEFSDMAGKALSVEWLVENASLVFDTPSAQ